MGVRARSLLSVQREARVAPFGRTHGQPRATPNKAQEEATRAACQELELLPCEEGQQPMGDDGVQSFPHRVALPLGFIEPCLSHPITIFTAILKCYIGRCAIGPKLNLSPVGQLGAKGLKDHIGEGVRVHALLVDATKLLQALPA
eukprot:scaffold56135_cov28-Tisochrysis_lutea.AAC.8